MRTATTALSQTNSVTGSLSYVDTLVTNATLEGQYKIHVGGQLLNDTMIGQLKTTYGYSVTQRYDDMGSYPTYLISWE